MNSEKKTHFWIPETEVKSFTKIITGRQKPKNVSYGEHGAKLSRNLQTIKTMISQTEPENSFHDKDIIVFNVELPEGERVQDNVDLLGQNSLIVRAVRDIRNAVVTATKSQFERLQQRIENYTVTGINKTQFENINSFIPYLGSLKDSGNLQRIVLQEKPPISVDIQLMLIPALEPEFYESALHNLQDKIKQNSGSIPEKVYLLSDNTPIIRAIVPSSSLSLYENDQAIYRIEPTSFFNVDAKSIPVTNLDAIKLNPDVDISRLPVVAILDSGVKFPNDFESLILQHWIAPGSTGGDSEHGTRVAGNAAFRYMTQNLQDNVLTPRIRLIDCNILDGGVSTQNLIKRVQEAVAIFSNIAKIYNLSANTDMPIDGDCMSIVGYELDMLQIKYGIQFVLSAGNHNLWQTQNNLQDIIDDDDSRISAPADSLYSITVGALVGEDHNQSLSKKNDVAPYSRIGHGFKGLMKPDISAYAGTVNNEGITPQDEYSLCLTKDGQFAPIAGTSFAAPIVTGDLAEITAILPDDSLILAKALLFHTAIPVWDMEGIDEETLNFAHKLYGRGLPNLDESKYSSPSKVTFVRTGTLNRTTKEHVTIYMPDILAAQVGRNIARVSITCVSAPPVDLNKGTEYLGAYIRISLKKADTGVNLKPVAPQFKENRDKWDICQYISNPFSRFKAGDWQIWLELFGRWDKKADNVPYALVVTIEDISQSLDIYHEIEVLNRYQLLNEARVKVRN